MENLGLAGEAKKDCDTLWVKWACLQVCNTVAVKESPQQRGQLSIRFCVYNGKCQRYTGGMYTVPFELTSTSINKVNIIVYNCILQL